MSSVVSRVINRPLLFVDEFNTVASVEMIMKSSASHYYVCTYTYVPWNLKLRFIILVEGVASQGREENVHAVSEIHTGHNAAKSQRDAIYSR